VRQIHGSQTNEKKQLVHALQDVIPSLKTVERWTMFLVLASAAVAGVLRTGVENETLRGGRLPVIDLVTRIPKNV
jgi:hypothetical protein